jgi:hypothetical protein
MIIVLKDYKAGGGINENVNTKYGRFSLSNLGYSSVQCSQTPVLMGEAELNCPYGRMNEIVTNGIGVNKKPVKKDE